MQQQQKYLTSRFKKENKNSQLRYNRKPIKKSSK